MITRNDNGTYEINGKVLTSSEANEIFRYIETVYHTQDLRCRFEEEYDDDTVDKIMANQQLCEDIVRTYTKYRSNDERWGYDLDEAISNFSNEIEATINN